MTRKTILKHLNKLSKKMGREKDKYRLIGNMIGGVSWRTVYRWLNEGTTISESWRIIVSHYLSKLVEKGVIK